jgi:prephenate dehydratase
MIKKVTIQGYEGSFHQVAAVHYFGKGVEVITCDTFREVVKIGADTRKADGAVMAIENSLAGSILPNYNLLLKSNLQVIGEVNLSISQNLMVNPGVKLTDIKEVHSHPMAILQCLDFLELQDFKLVESEDTALSAKKVHQHKSKHIAAIASKLAAQLYNLEIIKSDIHTLKNNITRFLILVPAKTKVEIENANKASIYFQTDHSKGILSKVLAKIALGGVNLSKLQSMPIPGSTFKYGFYADLEFENNKQIEKVLEAVKSMTNSFKVFGLYKKGKVVKG